jgi:hypothetical protein
LHVETFDSNLELDTTYQEVIMKMIQQHGKHSDAKLASSVDMPVATSILTDRPNPADICVF